MNELTLFFGKNQDHWCDFLKQIDSRLTDGQASLISQMILGSGEIDSLKNVKFLAMVKTVTEQIVSSPSNHHMTILSIAQEIIKQDCCI